MMFQPEVVVTEIGDELTARFLQSAVVRTGLMTGIRGKIDPTYARILDRRDHLFGVVGAAVADHQKLEIAKGLAEHAVDGKRQHGAPVVGSDDHGDAWRGHPDIS